MAWTFFCFSFAVVGYLSQIKPRFPLLLVSVSSFGSTLKGPQEVPLKSVGWAEPIPDWSDYYTALVSMTHVESR